MNAAPRLARSAARPETSTPTRYRAWIILGLAIAAAALIYGPTVLGLWALGGLS